MRALLLAAWLCAIPTVVFGQGSVQPSQPPTPTPPEKVEVPKLYFTTLAGVSSLGSQDGIGSAARFNQPVSITIDGTGNLYVADWGNKTIRKITSAGVVTTLAGKPGDARAVDGPLATARFRWPSHITVDRTGVLYVGDQIAIRQIGLAGAVSTLAGFQGDIPPAPSSVDGTGTAARFSTLTGLTISPSGMLYASDLGPASIRQITPQGVVTTLAGHGAAGYADGTGAEASFNGASGLAADAAGNLYVADTTNCTIRKIAPGGIVTTLAGRAGVRGAVDGIGANASFYFPGSVAVDLAGTVYVSDAVNQVIRAITPGGVVSTLAGQVRPDDGSVPLIGSSDGVGRAASFANPAGLATDADGNVFVADRDNDAIRKITPHGTVTTFAGLSPGKAIGWADAVGTEARFRNPGAITVAPDGTCFLVDTLDPIVRKITLNGAVTTLAGAAGQKGYADGAGAAARFSSLDGIARDTNGNLYVIDQRQLVRKITPDGVVSTFAGRLAPDTKPVDGAGANAVFVDLHAIAVAPDNSVWVIDGGDTSADPTHGGWQILFRRITPDGQVTTDERLRWVLNPHSVINGIAFSGGGILYAADAPYNRVLKITPSAIEPIRVTLPAPTTPVAPRSIAVDSLGRVYMVDGNYSTRIACLLPSGVTEMVAGTTTQGNADGFVEDALFFAAHSIAVDAEGSLYVTSNSLVRKGTIASAPVFLTSPSSQSVASGASITLSTNVRAVPAPQYQWYLNGAALAGATSASLTISSARTTDAGDYTVVATNALGSSTSARATLTVSSGGASGSASGGTSGGGGGGGAPSDFFVAACGVLALARAWARAKTSAQRE